VRALCPARPSGGLNLFQNDDGSAGIWLMSGTTPTLQTALEPNTGAIWHLQAG
jgi:hypothetical protein